MNNRVLRPASEISDKTCQNLDVFFMDIDDTFTTRGQITASAFQALWRLFESGISVVPVTGRPAGWCDMIARFWPVEAIIGENGAFYFSYDSCKKKMIRHFYQTELERNQGFSLLKELEKRVLDEIPGCAVSADQPFRMADLAIDFCEDIQRLPDESIRNICRIAEELGLNYKVSSIHVNCWYGSYDKADSLEKYLVTKYGLPLTQLQSRILFVGDSPNDEPLFGRVNNSVAVANIRSFLDSMTQWPTFVTREQSGDGFCELVNHILAHRT